MKLYRPQQLRLVMAAVLLVSTLSLQSLPAETIIETGVGSEWDMRYLPTRVPAGTSSVDYYDNGLVRKIESTFLNESVRVEFGGEISRARRDFDSEQVSPWFHVAGDLSAFAEGFQIDRDNWNQYFTRVESVEGSDGERSIVFHDVPVSGTGDPLYRFSFTDNSAGRRSVDETMSPLVETGLRLRYPASEAMVVETEYYNNERPLYIETNRDGSYFLPNTDGGIRVAPALPAARHGPTRYQIAAINHAILARTIGTELATILAFAPVLRPSSHMEPLRINSELLRRFEESTGLDFFRLQDAIAGRVTAESIRDAVDAGLSLRVVNAESRRNGWPITLIDAILAGSPEPQTLRALAASGVMFVDENFFSLLNDGAHASDNLEVLMSHGVSIPEDENGLPQDLWAVFEGPFELVKTLVELGDYLNVVDESGYSFFQHSLCCHTLAEIRELSVLGGQLFPDEANQNETILQAAAVNPSTEVVRFAIETVTARGISIDATNRWGSTALMIATRSNSNPEVIGVLLDAGADPTLRNPEDGKNAYEYAQENYALHGSDALMRLQAALNEADS